MDKVSDYELAKAFFDRISKQGFKVNTLDDNGKIIDLGFCQIDFHNDGSFYRIAGFTNGYWQDEVDWKKYGFGE